MVCVGYEAGEAGIPFNTRSVLVDRKTVFHKGEIFGLMFAVHETDQKFPNDRARVPLQL